MAQLPSVELAFENIRTTATETSTNLDPASLHQLDADEAVDQIVVGVEQSTPGTFNHIKQAPGWLWRKTVVGGRKTNVSATCNKP